MAVASIIKTKNMVGNPHSRTIYALFVGINQYAAGSRVGNLYGCVSDIERMDAFLSEHNVHRGRYEPKLLRNDQATRGQIIKEFRTHLGKATEEDVVLFMYAGHGSRQPSAIEFNDRNPDQMDETLVCYDSRLAGGLDLADKELAVLISELKAAHVVVILDSCHSGSGTRDAQEIAKIQLRSTAPRKPPRVLASYLDGYYTQQLTSNQVLSVPLRSHILLAACTRHEQAAEHFSGYGLFSNSLMTVLKSDGLALSYADLFLRCRIAIKKNEFNQTPQFECYAGEDPQATFLHLIDASSKHLSSLQAYSEAGRWYINLGALHDLPTDSGQTCIVTVDNINGTPIDTLIKGIGAERSELLIPTEIKMPETGTTPAALRMFTRPPCLITITATKFITEVIQRYWPSSLNIALADDLSIADFQFHETDTRLELVDLHKGILLQHTTQRNAQGVVALMLILKKVINWRGFRSLSNLRQEAQFFDAQVHLSLIDSNRNKIEWPSNDASIPYPEKGNGELAYYPICRVRNKTSQNLFFNLFYLSRKYGIALLEWKEIAPSEDWVTLWGKYDGEGFFLPPDLDETTEIFKIVISTNEIQTWLIAQAGFEVGAEVHGIVREMGYPAFSAVTTWVARSFETTLSRR